MNGPLCRGLYAVLILFQRLVEAKFFDMKDLVVTIISFIQHYFADCFNFYLKLR